jgi:hypothetical protein
MLWQPPASSCYYRLERIATMPWIANPNSDSLDIGTVLAIGNSLPPSGHQPVLKVGDELLIEQGEESGLPKAEVIQKSPDEMDRLSSLPLTPVASMVSRPTCFPPSRCPARNSKSTWLWAPTPRVQTPSSKTAEKGTRLKPGGVSSSSFATRGRAFVGCAVARMFQSWSYTSAR